MVRPISAQQGACFSSKTLSVAHCLLPKCSSPATDSRRPNNQPITRWYMLPPHTPGNGDPCADISLTKLTALLQADRVSGRVTANASGTSRSTSSKLSTAKHE
ncbi:hypothetical protein CONPUDRAFT_140696 [Coniophora puteana RWD-64-598 SS2]|uniref:Uncharacterized protein n=1 Tax=Coniophora puteana (strain RWD-64-598) TaxID=741705 RepID=R7SD62_CONPW|nr:uncharacterized protein CONPUDRAFT_140696 [Coniophora puteana RWD-64-598 SS2]EIW73790.1 hypothetical protein CONPUDRAFT_140696 [Coniophora puteana RWD-64-598 SS2]